MTEYEKAEAGLLYNAADPEINRGRLKSQQLCFAYNCLAPDQLDERTKIIHENLGRCGEKCVIEQPFYCDFWERVFVGENFYSNYNFVVLAGNRIEIGDNVMFGSDCSLYAAGHPFEAQSRNSGLEYAWPIHIGNNVWIGGGVRIMGGVRIGENTVVGAGSVVVSDIPDNVLAAGNPCRVIRKLDPKDDEKYRQGFQGWA